MGGSEANETTSSVTAKRQQDLAKNATVAALGAATLTRPAAGGRTPRRPRCLPGANPGPSSV